jgi:hypothetical protein
MCSRFSGRLGVPSEYVGMNVFDELEMKQALQDTPPTSLCERLAKSVERYQADTV